MILKILLALIIPCTLLSAEKVEILFSNVCQNENCKSYPSGRPIRIVDSFKGIDPIIYTSKPINFKSLNCYFANNYELLQKEYFP